jgi:hypothetical protein
LRVQGSGFRKEKKERDGNRYQESIQIFNGMERTLERQLPESDRRWPNSFVQEEAEG